jgi:hypothetical protein
MNESKAQSGGEEIPASYIDWMDKAIPAIHIWTHPCLPMMRELAITAYRYLSTHSPVVEGGLRWVDLFKEWLDEKMLYTQGMADHDGGAYWKGGYNILSDVKDKVEEWPPIPTQVTEPSTGMREEIERLRGIILELASRAGIILPVDEATDSVFDKGFANAGYFHIALHDAVFDNIDERSEPKPYIPVKQSNRPSPEPPTPEQSHILKLSEWLNSELVWQENHVKKSKMEFHKGALQAYREVAAQILKLTAPPQPTPSSNYPEQDAPLNSENK